MRNYNSELITWSDSFLCGITEIDEQHKQLILMINHLFLHTNGKKELERFHFCSSIDDVINYLQIHFATEEKILNAVKHSGFSQHKKEHNTFFQNLISLLEDYKKERNSSLAPISNYIRNWTLSHIIKTDKEHFINIKEKLLAA